MAKIRGQFAEGDYCYTIGHYDHRKGFQGVTISRDIENPSNYKDINSCVDNYVEIIIDLEKIYKTTPVLWAKDIYKFRQVPVKPPKGMSMIYKYC